MEFLPVATKLTPKNITLELLSQFQELKASDLHIVPDLPAHFRIDGKLMSYGKEPLIEGLVKVFLKGVTGNDDILGSLLGREEIDLASKYDLGGTEIRLRVNIALSQQMPFAVIRRLETIRYTPLQLGLPPEFVEMCENHSHGVVFITGTTGSGKSTTLASTLARMLESSAPRVITLEDPIEYLIPTGQGVVTQREIRRDTKDFESALRAAMRQDPDVILVGEVRDAKTAGTLLAAAETGHLVFTTLHVGAVTDVPERLGGMFKSEEARAVKDRLCNVLAGIMTQTLVPARKGRSLGWEFLSVGSAERELLREGRFPEIRKLMETKRFRLADSLVRLVAGNLVDETVARSVCNYREEWDVSYMEEMLARQEKMDRQEQLPPPRQSVSLGWRSTTFMDDDSLFFQ